MERGFGQPQSEAARLAAEKLNKVRYEVADTGVFAIPVQNERRAEQALKQEEIVQSAESLSRVEAIKAKLRGAPVEAPIPQETLNAPREVEAVETIEQENPSEAFESWKITTSKEIRSAHDRVIRMTSALDSAKQSQLTNEERLALMRDAGIRGVSAQDFSMYQGDIVRAIGREKSKLRGFLDTYKQALELGKVPPLDAGALDARLERGETSNVRIDFSNPELVKQALAEQTGNEAYPPYRNLKNAINSGRPGRDWQFMGQDSKSNYLFIEVNQAVEYDNGEQAKDHAIALSKKLVETYAKMI